MSDTMSRAEMLEDIHVRIQERAELEQLSDAALRGILWHFMLNDEWRDGKRSAASLEPRKGE